MFRCKGVGIRIFVLAAVMYVGSTSFAYAQSGTLSGLAATEAIDRIRQAITEAIDRIDNTVSSNSFLLRQHLQLLLSDLNSIAQGLVEKSFDELNRTQREAFENLFASIRGFNTASQRVLTDVRRTTSSFHMAIGSLPFAERSPIVDSFSPSYLLSQDGAKERTVTISVNGSFLAHGTVSLSFSGTPCVMTTSIDTEATFKCPAVGFVRDSQVEQVFGDLQFSLEKKRGTKPYRIGIFVVPSKLGDGTVTVTRKIMEREWQTKGPFSFGHRNDHCQGSREKTWNFSADPGWQIDTTSIDDENTVKSDNSSYYGISSVTSEGFQIKATVANRGRCFMGGGDARGSIRGTVSWREFRERPVIKTESLQRALYWGQDVPLRVPEDTVGFQLLVEQKDGQRVVILSGGNTQSKWLHTVWNPHARIIAIKPKELNDALN